jgi:hypothetical protein
VYACWLPAGSRIISSPDRLTHLEPDKAGQPRAPYYCISTGNCAWVLRPKLSAHSTAIDGGRSEAAGLRTYRCISLTRRRDDDGCSRYPRSGRLVNELVVDRWMPCRCRLYLPCPSFTVAATNGQWRSFYYNPRRSDASSPLYIINQVTDPPYGTVQ